MIFQRGFSDVAHLGHVEMLTPHHDEGRQFFTQIVGMEEVYDPRVSVSAIMVGALPCVRQRLTGIVSVKMLSGRLIPLTRSRSRILGRTPVPRNRP